ncbi:hypothetical protein E2C01_076855 [Portunus trituberculatus]|uniref:Uncharacterized protein n=1 Tax=Portunus trituberculatus TaxID=210409 RepID=A0A5B7IKR6_PORTR|nr:hypothetical protein [Portunus trituberculatus]
MVRLMSTLSDLMAAKSTNSLSRSRAVTTVREESGVASSLLPRGSFIAPSQEGRKRMQAARSPPLQTSCNLN